ncbi:hypothetical protein RFI_40348, partial [Reticulomyxa filosa]
MEDIVPTTMGRCHFAGLQEITGRRHRVIKTEEMEMRIKSKQMQKVKKWAKCQQKLLCKLEKINAKLNDDCKKETEQPTEPQMHGIWTVLIKTTAMEAYGRRQ